MQASRYPLQYADKTLPRAGATPCFRAPCGPENISWGRSRRCLRDKSLHVFCRASCSWSATDSLSHQSFRAEDGPHAQILHQNVKAFSLKYFARFLPISIYRRAWAARAAPKKSSIETRIFSLGSFSDLLPISINRGQVFPVTAAWPPQNRMTRIVTSHQREHFTLWEHFFFEHFRLLRGYRYIEGQTTGTFPNRLNRTPPWNS
jgi:hypothetical protein